MNIRREPEGDPTLSSPKVAGSATAGDRWRRREVLRVLPWLPVLGELAAEHRGHAQALANGVQSRSVRVNGVVLHYLEWGSPSAPPLVLLHPAPLNAHVWDRLGPLMATRFRVVAPDARGFGESEWSERYEPDDFLADLGGLIDALRLTRPILCGNSMGGTLAYMYAGRHPAGVDRLILVDVVASEPAPPDAGGSPPTRPPLPPPIPPGPFTSAEAAAAAIPAVMGPAFARAMVEFNLRRTPDGHVRWRYDHGKVDAAGARSMADPRKWPLWKAIQCPTLVLRGERSPALSPAVAARAASANRHVTVAVVAGAGHFVPLEAPEAFEAAVRQWLQV